MESEQLFIEKNPKKRKPKQLASTIGLQ